MKKLIQFSLLTLVSLFFSNFSVSQLEFPEDKVSWKFHVEQNGEDATIVGTISTVEGWHIYAANLPEGTFTIPTTIDLEPSPHYKVIGGVIEPKPEHHFDELSDEDLYYHSGTFKLKRKIKVLSEKDFTINGSFGFQTCDDSHCLPPHTAKFSVKVKGVQKEQSDKNETETTDKIDPVDTSNVKPKEKSSMEEASSENLTKETDKKNIATEKKEENKKSNRSLWAIFFIAFASGFAALLTPCVFPMIPMTVSFFTKQSQSKKEGIKNAIIFGISIILIYITLGTFVTAVFGSDALNAMSTNFWFNIIFFLLLVVFAISFLGAFEIRLPNSWLNKADKQADRGGMIGIFFMALALALVSFSCTGPIVGTLLVESATIGGAAPFIGMFGFSLALALPFTLFAAFPGWMNSMPKSGGWLNTVKVSLGFLELALAFKFLSNADLVIQAHWLERELFLAIWIGIFTVWALYLFGKITLPHDDVVERISVGRALLGTTIVIFVIYLFPGLWGAPLKLISGFPPPMSYSESPLGFGGGGSSSGTHDQDEHVDGMHLAEHGIMVFHDYEKGLAYAKKVGKPVLLDFTGYACVNCRRMESNVWGAENVLPILKNDVVMISLYVDDKTELPENEKKEVTIMKGKTRMLETYGNKWSHMQATRYKTNSQPYYRMLTPDGKDLSNGSADYQDHGTPEAFHQWLKEGLDEFEKKK